MRNYPDPLHAARAGASCCHISFWCAHSYNLLAVVSQHMQWRKQHSCGLHTQEIARTESAVTHLGREGFICSCLAHCGTTPSNLLRLHAGTALLVSFHTTLAGWCTAQLKRSSRWQQRRFDCDARHAKLACTLQVQVTLTSSKSDGMLGRCAASAAPLPLCDHYHMEHTSHCDRSDRLQADKAHLGWTPCLQRAGPTTSTFLSSREYIWPHTSIWPRDLQQEWYITQTMSHFLFPRTIMAVSKDND